MHTLLPYAERRPLQSPRGQDQEQMYDICKDCLVMGFAGFKMPRILKHAWKMGLSYTTSTGVIGNWPRYLFLIVQSLLLLGGVLFAYFIGDIDLPDYKYIRISFLSAALLVNFVERFTYWCLHAATRRPDNGSWNFYSDIIRLFLTEVFIYIALSTTMYSVTFHPSYRNYFSPLENSTVHSQHVHYGISMVVAIAVVFFLTACLMRNFVVYSVVRTLLKARKRDDNSHAGSLLKWFLSGLCIHTTALSVLQILQLLFVGLIFHKNDLPSSSYVSVVAFGFLAEIVPVASWFLYFLVSLPMVEMLPIAMLIDSPPAYSRNNQINIQAVSSLFRAMYSRWTSCRGICINVLRPFGSPFSSFAYMVFFVGGGYNVYFLIYTSFFSESSVSLVLVGCIAIMILIGFNFPAFIYGLLACLFVPILLFLYLFSAWLFKLNLNTIDTYLQ